MRRPGLVGPDLNADDGRGNSLIMNDPDPAPEPRDLRATDTPSGDPGGERIVAEAEEGIEDIEDEFGPEAPPRGATPGNPDAEEIPTNSTATS